MSNVNHPAHYGGEDNPYEVIKVLRAWDLELAKGFCWGNLIKYTSRADQKNGIEDREKAAWYAVQLAEIEKDLAKRTKKPVPKTTVQVTPSNQVIIDWENQSFRIHNTSPGGVPRGGGGGGTFAVGGSGATVKRCNSSWGCVHGYHGRSCPLWKDVP